MSTPGMPKKWRVISYIDGYNLYHGIREAGWRRFLWLDLVALSGTLIRGGQELVKTKYFTTRITAPEEKRKRQSDYIEALAAHCGNQVEMFWGHYQNESWSCRKCGAQEVVPHEKKTDVNIAVEMMVDAYADAFDTALLISADSDLVPPIRAIKRLFGNKRVVVAFPPNRHSVELRAVAHGGGFEIGRAKLAGSQMPEIVRKSDGAELHRPAKWTAAAQTAFGAALEAAIAAPSRHPQHSTGRD